MEKKEFIIIGLITILLAIDGLTGRWLPSIIEHIFAGILIPLWFFEIINFLSKGKFEKIKISISLIFYTFAIIIWEKEINMDFFYGLMGMTIFLIYFVARKRLK